MPLRIITIILSRSLVASPKVISIKVPPAAESKRFLDILVLDDGKLVGDAPHAELLRSCEVYKEICLSQLSKEEVAKTL